MDKEGNTDSIPRLSWKSYCLNPLFILAPLLADTAIRFFGVGNHEFELAKSIAIMLLITCIIPPSRFLKMPLKNQIIFNTIWNLSAALCLMGGFLLLRQMRGYLFTWNELVYYFFRMTPFMLLIGIAYTWVWGRDVVKEKSCG